MDKADLAWNLFTELRKEVLEAQKIRAQVIGFKITFVSASVGLIVANQVRIPLWLLIVPAFSAVFFDLLITSYSVSIKRIGQYIKLYLEPHLRDATSWPAAIPLWEEHMSKPWNTQRLSLVGNLGITLLVAVPALALVGLSFEPPLSLAMLSALALPLLYDVHCFFKPRSIIERQ